MAKEFIFPKVYPVTDLAMSGMTKHYQIVELLCRAGAKIIQLRAPAYTSWEWYYDALIAAKTAKNNKTVLIINNRADIARAIGAEGVHIGKNDLPPEAVRMIVGTDALMGMSTRSIEDAKTASDNPDIDYIAVGPVFKTITKNTGVEPLGLDFIGKVRQAVTKPVVAIGGITADRIADVLNAGADSAACISSIMKGNIPSNFESHLAAAAKAR